MKISNWLKSAFFFVVAIVFLVITFISPSTNQWPYGLPLGNDLGITPLDVVIYLSLLLGIIYLYKWTLSVMYSKHSSKIKRLSSIVILLVATVGVLIFVGLSVNEAYYRSFQIKYQTSSKGNTIRYEDKKFGYAFEYPSSWKKNYNSAYPGYVEIVSDIDPQTTVAFWYKDSKKIININDLYNFVVDDAKYDNEHNKSKTLSISKLEEKNAVLSKLSSSDGSYFEQYYFIDPSLVQSNIYVWTVGVIVKNGQVSKDQQSVETILKSYQLID